MVRRCRQLYNSPLVAANRDNLAREGIVVELRIPIVLVGVCLVLISIRALFKNEAAKRSLAQEIAAALMLTVGVITIFAAPVLSGLITYARVGHMNFAWWW
jgi:hypothetical protein